MILLDTHPWVWFVNDPDVLSKRAQKSVKQAMEERGLLVSSISVGEVCRSLRIWKQSYCRWRRDYGGLKSG